MRTKKARFVGFGVWCAAAAGLLLLPTPAPGAEGEPLQFDYQERTGYPLAVEERIVTLAEADALIQPALTAPIHEAPPNKPLLDWQEIRQRLEEDAPAERKFVRVVRSFSDQAVYIKDGFALLPDPSKPDQAVSPDDFNVSVDCDAGQNAIKSRRCVSLHRDHEQNQGVIAILLAARTVLVKGTNATGGLSLISITENLRMDASSHLDFSARLERAPTFGVGQEYEVYTSLVGSPARPVSIDAVAVKGFGEPSAGNPWMFEDFPDLQWQLDKARSEAPNYEWDGDLCQARVAEVCGEHCDTEAQIALLDQCYQQREPRGLAGLPGGHWLALTYRANTIRATSMGQPGGNGGPGISASKETKCNAPPVDRECGMVPASCVGGVPPSNPDAPPSISNPDAPPANSNPDAPPSNSNPDAPPSTLCDYDSDRPPHDTDVCRCDTCGASKCFANYGFASTDQDGCVVACEGSVLARGQRGGQAASGGLWGLIRVWASVRNSGCDADFFEDNLRDPAKAHLADERCLNNAPDERDPAGLVDCESELCSKDPNVTICSLESQRHGGGLGVRGDLSKDLLDKLTEQIRDKVTDRDIDLLPFNPIRHVDPDIFVNDTGSTLLELDDRYTAILEMTRSSLIPRLVGVAERPSWSPTDQVKIPATLFESSVTFHDAAGSLVFPSADAERIVTKLLGAPNTSAPSGAASNSAVFGFEAADTWSSTGTGLAQSSDATQGTSSLSVAAVGWQQLTSPPIASVGVGSAVAFDLKLPSPAVNPWWAGDVSVVIDAPSAGIYDALVGQRSLQGLPLDSFVRISLPLDTDLVNKLSQPYSDLRVKLTLNVPSGPGRYLFDNLSLDERGSATSIAPPAAMSFSVSLPRALSLTGTALGATSSLRIADGARINSSDGGAATIANTGSDETNIGVEARAGSIASVGRVVLRDRARIDGQVTSEATISLAADAVVTGAQLSPRSQSPFQTLSWTQQPSKLGAAVLLEPDRFAGIEPDSYGPVSVRSRSTLALSTGTYFMESLAVEPQGRLLVDATDGPVILVVRSAITFRGALVGAEPESVLINYAGTSTVALEASLGATIVAPNATLRYATGSTTHAGAAFAKAIEVDPYVTFEHRPFAFWSLLGGAGGNDRFSQMTTYVRGALASANAVQLRDRNLDSRAVLELAKFSASATFRDAFRNAIDTARVKVPVDLLRDSTPFLKWYRRSGDLRDRVLIGIGDWLAELSDFERGPIKRICGDDASGAKFGKSIAGATGSPGEGGQSAAPRRCLSFQSSFPSACVRQATTSQRNCNNVNTTRGCPRPDCETRYFFPRDGEACPAGYTVETLPAPFGTPTVCPAQIDLGFDRSGGNVDCTYPPGASGTELLPASKAPTNNPPNRVGTWGYSRWAAATHRLQGGELSRRVGRANTLYKRDELIPATARYLATRTMAQANYLARHGSIACSINPNSCPVCPQDPNTLSNDEDKRLCALVGDTNAKLRQIVSSLNYYGYSANFIPPASARLHDPSATFDLLSLVRDELSRGEQDSRFWLKYGAILNSVFNDVNSAVANLNTQQSFLADATDPQGSLGLELEGANLRVRELAGQLQLIHEELKALNVAKAKLSSSGGIFEIDLMEFVGVVVSAAAAAYGGPFAGVAVASIWAGLEQGLSSDDAAAQASQARANSPGASVLWKNGCLQSAQDSKKRPTGDECFNSFKDKLVDGLVESKAVKELVNKFLIGIGLKGAEGPDATRALIIDSAIASLTVEANRAGSELGSALQTATIVEERYREGLRQLARIAAAKGSLQNVPASGFPAPEVQLALADLAFQSAAASVDRAGDAFFLYRRGVERDVLPLHPVTGLSTLTAREKTFLRQQPECEGVTSASLDVNFATIPCFERRVDFLKQAAASAHGARSADFIEVADATVPFTEWTLGTDADGDEAYSFSLSIDIEKAQRGSRGSLNNVGELKQAIRDATFFLETNDPAPAPVRLKIRRPTDSADLFYIGRAQGIRQFQFFDVARGGPAAPETPMFELLRDSTSYERFGFACNGADELDDLPGGLAKCKLSNLSEQERAFLIERSLIGTLDFTIKRQDLGGRTPVKFFALVDYFYTIPTQ